jgi:hypothetical protein
MSLFNFFSSFLQKNEPFSPLLTNTDLLKKIAALNDYSDLHIITNSVLGEHDKQILLPLLILDKERGLYIFELRSWRDKELKNIKITASKVDQRRNDNLAFSLIEAIIREKTADIISKESLPLHKLLILDSLSSSGYDTLDASIQEYLPKESLIFNDTSSAEIFQKIQTFPTMQEAVEDTNQILCTLYPQYTIAIDNKELFATDEQRAFLDTQLTKTTNLAGKAKAGKSSALALKLLQILKESPKKDILVLCAHEASKENLEHKLQENAKNQEVSLQNITLTTALEFLQEAYQKINFELKNHDIQTSLYIDEVLLKKRKKAADLLVCEDAQLLKEHFLDYLELIQNKAELLFINHPKEKALNFTLNNSFFHLQEKPLFAQKPALIQTMHHVQHLLRTKQDKRSILICSNELTQQKLQEDLQNYIDPLQYTTLFYSNYTTIEDISIPHVILLDICQFKTQIVEYALTRATQSVALFYEDACGSLKILKENYES